MLTDGKVAAGVALLFLIVVPMAAVTRARPDSEWWKADAASWLEALATVGALVAAFAAARATWRTLIHELQRDADREAERRRHQAERFSCWLEPDPNPIAPERFLWLPREPPGYFVRNSSELPIFNVVVTFWLGFLNGTGGQVLGPAFHDVVPPGNESVRFDMDGAARAGYVGLVASQSAATSSLLRVMLEVDFVDAAGTRWHRDFRGVLSSIEVQG